MSQILCKCGRVAELRRRKNGQKLPYVHCKSCGLQQGKKALRAEWLTNEDASNSLGVLGEFVQNSPSTSNKHQKEWTPPDELAPEEKQAELAAKTSAIGETSKSGIGFGVKVFLGLLSVVGLAFGVSKLN